MVGTREGAPLHASAVRLTTRRQLLTGLGAAGGSVAATGAYAVAIEPGFRLRVARYALTPPGWPAGLRVTLCVLADLHAGEPWMGLSRVRRVVTAANALAPDVMLFLGDLTASYPQVTRHVPVPELCAALAGLRAPLGTYAVLGNHDWWDDREVQRLQRGPPAIRLALEAAGLPVLENTGRQLRKGGQPFWLLGLGDQWAFHLGHWRHRGVDDLPATLALAEDGAPVILLAHEPDIFPRVPPRVSLTLSGHTHGGQVLLLGWRPMVPSVYGARYAYGHVVEGGRHLIVSGGLGCSIAPVRFGVPPEIVHVTLGR